MKKCSRTAFSPSRDGPLWDAVVLGAGASGLFCAGTAAARGRRVLIIDHAQRPGRKLSITGGGKCNATNLRVREEDYHGENPRFCRSALARCAPEHLMALLTGAGVELEERGHGQIFCRRSARDVVRCLAGICQGHGCRFALGERVLGLERASGPGRFLVRTAGALHRARKVVLALGSPAWPQTGATGTGYELARAMGHAIVPVRPALVGLVMPQDWPLAGLAGVSLPVAIHVRGPDGGREGGGKKAGEPAARNLPLLFTHNGISGPAALQASLYWRPGARLALDFLPGLAETEGVTPLLEGDGTGKKLCRTVFRQMLPDRLCDALLPESIGARRCADLGRAGREALAGLFRRHEAAPARTEGFARAEVAAGGVSTRQFSSQSMESRIVPGLYCCGEMLDVTGRLGGYNLHWAFASGKAAGEAL